MSKPSAYDCIIPYVFNAVVDHLHKVSRADRPAMQIALLRSLVKLFAARRMLDLADAGRERLEDWIDGLHGLVRTADHHAVSALETPNAAAGPDVHIVDALLLELGGATHVVFEIRIAAVDDDVTRLHQVAELRDHAVGGRAGGHHHPSDARFRKLLHEVREIGCAGGAFAGQFFHGVGGKIVGHAGVSVFHQAPNDVAAHTAQANHSEFTAIDARRFCTYRKALFKCRPQKIPDLPSTSAAPGGPAARDAPAPPTPQNPPAPAPS